MVGLAEEGDSSVECVASLGEPHDRCLYFIAGYAPPEFRESVARLDGCIVIVRDGAVPDGGLGSCRIVQVPDPRAAIARVLEFIRAEGRQRPWVTGRRIAADAFVSPLALVEGDVVIEEGARVEAFCSVGPDVAIGRHAVIRSGARVFPRVSIGAHSVIGANSVIGSEGYGFVRDETGEKTRIPHLGGVTIGEHVEIGALSIVQYGTLAPTMIEDWAKIDDNVEVGHNVRVGRGASVTGGTVIGGSAVIGADAWIGINSSVRNGCSVGDGALIGMDSSVQGDVPADGVTRTQPATITREARDAPGRIGFPPGRSRRTEE